MSALAMADSYRGCARMAIVGARGRLLQAWADGRRWRTQTAVAGVRGWLSAKNHGLARVIRADALDVSEVSVDSGCCSGQRSHPL